MSRPFAPLCPSIGPRGLGISRFALGVSPFAPRVKRVTVRKRPINILFARGGCNFHSAPSSLKVKQAMETPLAVYICGINRPTYNFNHCGRILLLKFDHKIEVSVSTTRYDWCQGNSRNPKCSLKIWGYPCPATVPPALSSHCSRHFVSAVPNEVPGGRSLRVSAAHAHFGAKPMVPAQPCSMEATHGVGDLRSPQSLGQ